MADYKEALQAGFAAAKKAEKAREEIQEILEKLKADVLAVSDGKILIELRKFEESAKPASALMPNLTSAFAQALKPKVYFWALIASNPKAQEQKARFKEMARWKQAKEGYP